MTSRVTQNHRTSIRWLPCINVSGEEIPGGALLRYVGLTNGMIEVDMPDTDNVFHAINDLTPILTDGVGQLTEDFPNYVAFDPALDPMDFPAAGESWGAKAGEWYMTDGQAGLFVIGGVDEDRFLAYCTRTLAAGGGSDTIRFASCVRLETSS